MTLQADLFEELGVGRTEDPADRNHWRTPPELFARLDREFNFALDGAADDSNYLRSPWFGPGGIREDALADGWNHVLDLGEAWPTIYLNPPYSDPSPWVERCVDAWQLGSTVAAVLTNDTSTSWANRAWSTATEVRVLPRRVDFIDPATGKPVRGNPRGTMIYVWRAHLVVPSPHVFRWDYR